MSTQDNKALARRYIEELFNQKNLAVFDELCAPNFVWHNASTTMQGQESCKQFLSMLLSGFPDLHITIEDLIAEGDLVAERLTFRGTHQGDLLGIPSTGKQIHVTGLSITRVANGKCVEFWTNSDDLGLMQQLGVILTQG